MILKEEDGILCDWCALEHRENFIYYSVEGIRIVVRTSVKATNSSGKVVDFDICKKCYDEFVGKMVQFLHNVVNTIRCEYCGETYKGDFEYVNLLFTKATVSPPSGASKDEPYIHDVDIDRHVLDMKVGPCCLATIMKKTKGNRDGYIQSIGREERDEAESVRPAGSAD